MIHNIVYNDNTLCVLIENKAEKSMRIDLRSLQTMTCLWTLLLQFFLNSLEAFLCYSINSNEWLVTDRQSESLLHISTDGQIKQTINYNSSVNQLKTFGTDIFAIATKTCLNFHKLN